MDKALQLVRDAVERYSVAGAGHGGWQFSTDKANKIVDDFMDGIAAAHK